MSARPGVLLVGNFLGGRGAAPQVCEALAARLEGAGWPVVTTSPRRNRALRLFDMCATAWARRADYAVAHVDVFSGAAFRWAEAVCWTLRRAGKPYGLTLHGGNLPDFAARHPARVRRLLGSAAWVTAPSPYLAGRMRPYRADLRILPNALDLAALPFAVRAAPRPRLAWLRAFNEIYDPSLGPAVVARLRPEFPGVTLDMTGADKGDGSLARARRAAETLGVADAVRFHGPVPKAEVGRRLSEGDLFLNTTRFDNTPVSVLEAMACGLCVVSTAVGGIPDLLEDGADALLVPPGDAEAMAAAVRRVLVEPGLAERLSRAARAKAEGCDWAAVLPRWEALLAETAGSKVPRRAPAAVEAA